jgi:hypothetical protein
MPGLSPKEIADVKLQLADWQTPDAMSRLVDDIMNRMGAKDLFNQSGLALLRDAWIAAEFGRIQQAEHVHLIGDTWPDFELIEGRVELFEAVEADDPERRRGDEFRKGTEKLKTTWWRIGLHAPKKPQAWLETACWKKLTKRYSARANLVKRTLCGAVAKSRRTARLCLPSRVRLEGVLTSARNTL